MIFPQISTIIINVLTFHLQIYRISNMIVKDYENIRNGGEIEWQPYNLLNVLLSY